jgi:hypothetical protein
VNEFPILERGTKEKLDTDGRVLSSEPHAALVLLEEGRPMKFGVLNQEGLTVTSVVVERRVTSTGYEIRTRSGSRYRFTPDRQPQQRPSSLAGIFLSIRKWFTEWGRGES